MYHKLTAIEEKLRTQSLISYNKQWHDLINPQTHLMKLKLYFAGGQHTVCALVNRCSGRRDVQRWSTWANAEKHIEMNGRLSGHVKLQLTFSFVWATEQAAGISVRADYVYFALTKINELL